MPLSRRRLVVGGTLAAAVGLAPAVSSPKGSGYRRRFPSTW